MHPLLRRQLLRSFGGLGDVPREIEGLLGAVDAAYHQADDDRRLLERAMELTSGELDEKRADLEGQLAQRVQAEAELAHTVATLTATPEATAEGILVIDSAGRVPHFNRRFVEMWGIPEDVLATRDEAQMFGVVATQIANREEVVAGREEMLQCPSVVLTSEARLVDGRTFSVCSKPQTLNGAVIGRVLSFRDTTAERQAQRMLEQLAAFPEHCPAEILETDLQGAVTYANPSALLAFPGILEDGVEHPAMQGLEDALERFRAGDRRPSTREVTVGLRSYVQVAACAERGEPVLIYHHDISERVQLEQQLRQAQKMETIGQLAGGIAHDFINLLTAIIGNAQLLCDLPAADAETPVLLGEIQAAAERASSLTSQLLTFSRRQPYSPRRLDLDETLKKTERILRRLISEDVGFSAAYAADGACVEMDPGQVDQIVVNLVVNARDAVGAGGTIEVVTSAIELVAPLRSAGAEPVPAGRYVCIEVRDNGAGMSPDVLSRMFEPFFTTKPQGKGTGLGLATVFGIVKQARGGVAVDSAPGRGTVFRIYLPQAAPAAPVETARPKASPSSSRPGVGRRALLVEDEEPVRRLTRRVLERLGFEVIEAVNGLSALAIASRLEGRIDLLVSDVVMPELSGPEAARKLRVMHPGLAVVFMSGYAADELVKGEPVAGAQLVLKPFTSDGLADVIAAAVAGRQ